MAKNFLIFSFRHGTRCAGVVAATANNSLCTVGIAYNARIGGMSSYSSTTTTRFSSRSQLQPRSVCLGVRMLDGDMTDIMEAKSLSLRQQYIDIYSSSWGPEDDGRTVDGPGRLAGLALESGIRKVRLCMWFVTNLYSDSFPPERLLTACIAGQERSWLHLCLGIRKWGKKSGPLLMWRLHKQHLYHLSGKHHQEWPQALVSGGMFLHSGLHLQQRREPRDCEWLTEFKLFYVHVLFFPNRIHLHGTFALCFWQWGQFPPVCTKLACSPYILGVYSKTCPKTCTVCYTNWNL